jgi:hypothetical protein
MGDCIIGKISIADGCRECTLALTIIKEKVIPEPNMTREAMKRP